MNTAKYKKIIKSLMDHRDFHYLLIEPQLYIPSEPLLSPSQSNYSIEVYKLYKQDFKVFIQSNPRYNIVNINTSDYSPDEEGFKSYIKDRKRSVLEVIELNRNRSRKGQTAERFSTACVRHKVMYY